MSWFVRSVPTGRAGIRFSHKIKWLFANVALGAPVWNYWAYSFAPYRVVWSKSGRIREVATDPATLARKVYRKRNESDGPGCLSRLTEYN